MATPCRQQRHPNAATWSAAGQINLELAPKPFCITRMGLWVELNVTTTTATNFNDYYDRAISRLSLTGNGRTYFDFTNMRAAYHFTRFGGYGLKRPTVLADSSTTLVIHFGYLFHFGVAPKRINPASGCVEDNPFDLTAGIPPVEAGNLTLQGTWGAASAMGTNVTINSGEMHVYLWGVNGAQPQALPEWSMQSPTPTATSSAFATSHNIPAGNFLRSLLVMTTNGTNSPRDDSVLNSLRFYNQKEGQTILEYGGQAGAVADYKPAEAFQQFPINGWPPTDNVSTAMTALTGTAGVPSILGVTDSGLVPIRLFEFTGAHPLYGLDLRNVATGDYQLQYGVSDATGVTLDIVYEKYSGNRAHPAGRLLLSK